jgi:hypothetical protein
VYDLLFRTSASALQQLARAPRFVGGQIGMVGVLHTWTRDLMYHPHVHYLVPGGGLAPDGQAWLSSRPGFLVHVRPLGRLFRAQFRAALHKTGLAKGVPAQVWTQEWVVHCQAVGSGVTALKYLAPYIFRVAISNRRLVKWEEDHVTFRYTVSETGKTRCCTVTAEEFIRRFLQHVLPKGFVKVRYYGFFSPAQRPLLSQIRRLLELQAAPQPTGEPEAEPVAQGRATPAHSGQVYRCPKCGQAMRWVEVLSPLRGRPP